MVVFQSDRRAANRYSRVYSVRLSREGTKDAASDGFFRRSDRDPDPPPPAFDLLGSLTNLGRALIIAWLATSTRAAAAGNRRLAYPLLAATGLKLLLVDLRLSQASTLFAGLACYGAALVLVLRLRKGTE